MISCLTVAAPYMVYDGYGSMAEHLVLGMAREGVEVHPAPLVLDLAGCTREFIEMFQRSTTSSTGPVVFFCWPHPRLDNYVGLRQVFIYTTFESSRLPTWWPGRINRCAGVIVPTRFAARIFRDNGITVPIEVVPQGVDPQLYDYEDRPHSEAVTTLMVATAGERKHVAEGIIAWKRAFDHDSSARLIIKTRSHFRHDIANDSRIQFIDSTIRTRGIAEYYRQADVLLALGNEGFGLPLVEAMATGLPVIALSSEGQGDICEEVPQLLLPVSPRAWEHADDGWGCDCGIRGVPDVDAIIDRLRWVAENRDEAARIGRDASSWVLKHRDVRRLGSRVLRVLERWLAHDNKDSRLDGRWN